MTVSAKAYIRWLSNEEGGRHSIPFNLHHVIVSRFEDNAAAWPNKAWSLIIDFSSTPSSNYSVLANVRFLAPNGPIELFYSGSRFELLDGPRVIAKGEIL